MYTNKSKNAPSPIRWEKCLSKVLGYNQLPQPWAQAPGSPSTLSLIYLGFIFSSIICHLSWLGLFNIDLFITLPLQVCSFCCCCFLRWCWHCLFSVARRILVSSAFLACFPHLTLSGTGRFLASRSSGCSSRLSCPCSLLARYYHTSQEHCYLDPIRMTNNRRFYPVDSWSFWTVYLSVY